MTKIKICGVRRLEHALVAATAGADYVGVIFAAESPRRISALEAQSISKALKAPNAPSPRPLLVGVFVNQPALEMNELADFCGLDLLQLSGDEPWDLCNDLNRPVIKAVRAPVAGTARTLVAELEREAPRLQHNGGVCLLEPQVVGQYGGTGQRVDLSLAQQVAQAVPFLLAGGLTPENVADALAQVHPWGVDVSSGVENNGKKDPDKIRAFIAAVRAVDGSIVV